MDMYALQKADSQEVIAKIKEADSFFSRLRGLTFKKNINEREGLLLTKTKQIHTHFMFFAIDVIYLKKETENKYLVIDLEKDVKPWRISKARSKATDVLELKNGMINRTGIKIGSVLVKKSYTKNKKQVKRPTFFTIL